MVSLEAIVRHENRLYLKPFANEKVYTETQFEHRSMPSLPGSSFAREREDRLRVLHVVSFLGLGGTEHCVLKVIRGLGNDDFEHCVCAVRGVDLEFTRSMQIEWKVRSVGSPEPGMQFPLFRLVRIMREFRPHIVHTRNFGALEAIPAARLAGVPVAIHSEHGYDLEILDGLPLRRRVLCRAIFPLADAVFTVTRDLRSFHAAQSWLPEKRFRIIHNGVDTARFAPRPEASTPVRKELGISSGSCVLGSVGRLVPIKDHATLLRAAEIALLAGYDVHVLLVGSGAELPKLRAYVAASRTLPGHVSLTGASDRVPDMLNAMDVFVLPSVSEGMSNTILEAMATGLPVLATRSGGNPELVDDGRSGRLFATGDAESLARQIVHLVTDVKRRHQMGEEARSRVADQFSLADMVRHYRELYAEMAERRGLLGRN